MLKPTSRNLDMDIDDDHVNKILKLSQGTKIEIGEEYKIIDYVPGSVTQVSTFKIEEVPSNVVLKRESKTLVEEKSKKEPRIYYLILKNWRRNLLNLF